MISIKNTEIEKFRFEIIEKETSNRLLKENIEKLRLESMESLKNYENSKGKYQILMKKRALEIHQKTINKKNEFLEFEEIYEEEPKKKREYEKNVDDFFEKIKEIKKERGFLIDFEDMDENEENNEGFIEENRSFMAQNYKIEEKPEFMVKKHEKNISIDQKIVSFKEEKPIFDRKIEENQWKSPLNLQKPGSSEKTIEKPDFHSETLIKPMKKEVIKEISPEKEAFSLNKSPFETLKPIIQEKPKTYSFFEEEPQKQQEMNKKPLESLKNLNFPEKKLTSNEKKTLEPEKKLSSIEKKPLETEKKPRSNEKMPLEPVFSEKKPLESLKPLISNEKKSLEPEKKTIDSLKHLNFPEKKPFEASKNLSVHEKPSIENENSFKMPEKAKSSSFFDESKNDEKPSAKKDEIKPFSLKNDKKNNEKEALTLNFFEKKPLISEKTEKNEKSDDPLVKKDESPRFLSIPMKNPSKLPGLPSLKSIEKSEKIEPHSQQSLKKEKNDILDEFDDLLGELDFMSGPPKKEEKKAMVFEKGSLEKKEEKKQIFNLNSKEFEKKTSEMAFNEKTKENEKKTTVVENKDVRKYENIKEKEKDEGAEEIEEDIDFGE